MNSHHDVAKFTSHENIERWNPFPVWAEKILDKEEIPESVMTAATVLLYVVVFFSLFNGMETRTIAGV